MTQSTPASVRSLERGLRLLQAMNRAPHASVTQLARDIAVPRSTAYRLLDTLVGLGFVTFGTDGYALSRDVRTLSDGFARSSRAREIIDAVKRGLARDPKTIPPLEHNVPMSAEANATVELLKVLLKAAAARHKVAPRLIADNDELEQIASEAAPAVRTLTGWRRTVFGDDALRLKRGEIALTLKHGEVVAMAAQPADA